MFHLFNLVLHRTFIVGFIMLYQVSCCNKGFLTDEASHNHPGLRLGLTEGRGEYSALWVSLYWESDLRNPSYFLNKRKELEFNN